MDILAFGMIGMPEVVLIGFIALLVYGKKLPEMARSLGKSVQEFKSGMQEHTQIPSGQDAMKANVPDAPLLTQSACEIEKETTKEQKS